MAGMLQSHSGGDLPTGQYLNSQLRLPSVYLPHTSWEQESLFIYRNPIQRLSLLHFPHIHAFSFQSRKHEPPNNMVWLKAVQRG